MAPAECGAYGGFDPRWGRHSGGITNLTDHKRLLFFHKNNQQIYLNAGPPDRRGAARATAASFILLLEREKAQMFYREK